VRHVQETFQLKNNGDGVPMRHAMIILSYGVGRVEKTSGTNKATSDVHLFTSTLPKLLPCNIITNFALEVHYAVATVLVGDLTTRTRRIFDF